MLKQGFSLSIYGGYYVLSLTVCSDSAGTSSCSWSGPIKIVGNHLVILSNDNNEI